MNSVICNYIKGMTKNQIKQAFAEKFVNVRFENNLALFSYGRECDFTDPLVQEARGIIIDLNTNSVVCWPFRKFGNYGEPYADEIDWTSAKVQEKVDGSIMKVWFYDGKWRVSTNKSIDAYSNNNAYIRAHKSFGQLFDEAAEDAGLDYNKLDKDYTYIFELVSPELPIVIRYEKSTLYHLGTRNNKTGEEIVADIGVKKPHEYHLNSLEDCIAAAKMMNENRDEEHLIGEGYVVVDKNWNRVKIKSPAYLQVHYCLAYSNPTERRILSIIRMGEVEEVCSYFPPFREKVNAVQAKIDRVHKIICDTIYSYEDKAKSMDRGTFFKNFGKDRWGDLATSYYYNEVDKTVEEYITIHLDRLAMEKLIKLFNEE